MHNERTILKVSLFITTLILICFTTSMRSFAVASRPAQGYNMIVPKLMATVDQTRLYAVTPGNWGGTGINVVVEKKSVNVQYDCAEGEMSGPLKTDKKGNFRVDGFHTRHAFGPTRLDNMPRALPARYEGKIIGNVMTVKVTLTKTNEVVGEFTLERGKTGRLRRCA